MLSKDSNKKFEVKTPFGFVSFSSNLVDEETLKTYEDKFKNVKTEEEFKSAYNELMDNFKLNPIFPSFDNEFRGFLDMNRPLLNLFNDVLRLPSFGEFVSTKTSNDNLTEEDIDNQIKKLEELKEKKRIEKEQKLKLEEKRNLEKKIYEIKSKLNNKSQELVHLFNDVEKRDAIYKEMHTINEELNQLQEQLKQFE